MTQISISSEYEGGKPTTETVITSAEPDVNRGTLTMQLQRRHIDALDKAEQMILPRDFCPYLELKSLLPNDTPLARSRFRSLFVIYYGMNVGGLTDAFKDRFFEILFAGIENGPPDFQTILSELSLIPRKKGGCAIPFSFVSKLVAIHNEASPIYDRHVLTFFVTKAPTSTKAILDRISWFVNFLSNVAADYAAWAHDERVAPILNRLKARAHQLTECDNIRLIDFLVWKVGNQKLL